MNVMSMVTDVSWFASFEAVVAAGSGWTPCVVLLCGECGSCFHLFMSLEFTHELWRGGGVGEVITWLVLHGRC